MKKPNFLSRLFSDERNYERPFFLFLTLVLVGIYLWSLTSSTALDSVWKIALFTILMNIHIVLYWISLWVFNHPRWIAPLLVVQGLVALAMGMLVRVVGITFGLYPGLIGLVIGLPTRRIWRVLAIAYFLTLSLFNYIAIAGLGATLWWFLGTIPIVLFVAMYVLMYLRQAEAREQAQSLLRDLESANRQLTEYAARVEDLTIANERQRLARELHDTLSQGLAGLILQLEAVDAHLAGSHPDRARTILQQAMEKARGTLDDARKAIADLRQTGVRDLIESIHQEVERFTTATGIACEPRMDNSLEVPGGVSEVILRSISEGLTNIARHAHARQVGLNLTASDNRKEILLEILDDGVGFDPDAVQAGHFGLLGISERVRLAGGSCEVRSEPEKGTRLVIRFPYGEHAT